MLESHRLGEDGRLRLGWANVLVSLALGLACVWLGDRIGGSAVTDALKLTTYFGERDRAGDRFLADALADLYARHQLRTSLVLRGVAGFGVKHHLHTDRLLTLSEDLPMVSVAVDARARIEALLDEVVALSGDGLITLERARMADAAVVADVRRGDQAHRLPRARRARRTAGRRTSPSSTRCTATASPAPPCCSASTAPRAASAGARASSPPTRRCR